jgi:hypothetical protein
MKKILTLAAVLTGFVASSYGQGTVLFSTSAAAATKVSTNAAVGGVAAGLTVANAGGGADYYYALFYSTAGSTVVGSSSTSVVGTNGTYAFNAASGQGWTFVASGTNTASAGKFAPFLSSENSDGSITIPTVAAAATAELVAIGWSATIGTTWQAVQSFLAGAGSTLPGWVGQSAVASIPLGNAPGTGSLNPESMFGATTGQVGGILLGEVIPTPEPGTLALAALGGASLLMFRRKNK